MAIAPPSRHFFVCPYCPGHADLESHRCAKCGAGVVGVLWGPNPELTSPELALVDREHFQNAVEFYGGY